MKRDKIKLTFTNKFGLALMLLSVALGITIWLSIGNTMEVFYAAPTLVMGAILLEKE